MEPNTHKYHLKLKEPDQDSICDKNLVNVSRSIGDSGNWIGCGFIDKSGIKTDHRDTQFPFYSLVYVVEGRGVYIDEHQITHPVESGSFFQRRPGVTHSTLIDPTCAWQEYYIDLNTEFYEQLAAISLIQKDVPVYQATLNPSTRSDFENLMRLLSTSAERRLPDIALRFLSVIRDLVNQGNLSGSDPDSALDDMIEKSCFDFNRAFDKRIDLNAYCRENGWGYESFRKSFKQAIGVSPGKYIVRRRLDEGCRLLRATSMRISEISDQLGYKTQHEFSNQFKRQFGVFPTQFRHGS